MYPNPAGRCGPRSITRSRKLGVAVLWVALALGACARYEPQPLDLAAYQAEWQAVSQAPPVPVASGGSAVALDDGVALAEAELIALVYHPALRALRLRAHIPLAAADQAGGWSDPELGLDVEHVLEDVDDPWVVMGSLAVTIPLSGSPAARRRLREAEAEAALAEVLAQEWAVRMQLRRAWVDWSRAQAARGLWARHVAALAALLTIAERWHEGGQFDAPQTRAIRLAHASARLDHDEAVATEAQARRRVLELCGLYPDTPLVLEPAWPQASAGAAREDLTALLAHPELRAALAAYQVAEQAVALAVRRQYPDLRIGLGGGVDEGQSKLALGLGLLPLPVWNGNAEELASSRAERAAVAGETRALLQALTHRLATARQRHGSASRQLATLEGTLIPMVEAQDRDLRSQVERGRVDMGLLLDANERSQSTRLRALEAGAAVALAAVELDAALGPLLEPGLEAEATGPASADQEIDP